MTLSHQDLGDPQPVSLRDNQTAHKQSPTRPRRFDNHAFYADAIAEVLGDRVRYFTSDGEWLFFDPDRGWQRDAEDEVINEVAEFAKAELLVNGGPNAFAPNHGSTLAGLGNYGPISNTLKLVGGKPRIKVVANQLDADATLIGCQNGVLNLGNGDFQSFTPDKLVTRRLAASYNPNAKAPTWEAFLSKVQPDPEMQRFIQRCAGYSLSGEVREHVILFHYGAGANGKGTFLEQALLKLLKDYGTKLTDSLTYHSKNSSPPFLEIAGLCGRRFALGEENGEGGRLNERILKAMSGGDQQKGRFHHKDFFEYYPTYKIHLVGNHKPDIKGTDDGFWRRFLLIDWPVQIPPEERDNRLKEKLSEELSGILNWCLEGYHAWDEGGLNPPKACLAASQTFREESDEVQEFITERLIETPTGEVSKGRLYQHYLDWTNSSGAAYMSKKAFGTSLQQKGWRDGYSSSLRQRIWKGWRINEII
jgi:putative DNA primase/helicase